jgi:signal transduction histidine kinase
MSYKRLIMIAGAIAWGMVGLPAFIYHANAPTWNWGWVAAFVMFGATFAADMMRPQIWLLAVESAAAIALILLRCNGYEGTLLVVLAMQLGPQLGRSAGLVWIGLQTALLASAVGLRLSPRAALLLAPPYLGFQLLAFFVFHIMAREVATRSELAKSNAELRAAQQVLAESSRMAERLRITHELHDALGHRLTALTLNLEAVLHCTQGAERARVELCQSLARQLLSDVREIVAESRTRENVAVEQALQALTNAVPRPRVHLNVAEGIRIFDPEAAHVLLRCVQEITTNAARHSGAENLWIIIEQEGTEHCARTMTAAAVMLRTWDSGSGECGSE